MISEIPLRWVIWAIVVFVALRCLIAMAILLRDRLQDLLVAHVKRQQVEAKKRVRIRELREKIRAKKASAAVAAEIKEFKEINEKKAA